MLSTGAFLRINAHAGDDTIVLSPVDHNLDLIRGGVSVIGGDGTDAVVLNDRNFLMGSAPGTLPYFVHPGLVQKVFFPDPNIPFGKFPGLGYSEIEDLTLHAADGNNSIIVSGTPAGTNLHLFGNGGADVFALTAPPAANVTIAGGAPTAGPGDSLALVGTPASVAIYTTGAPGAGDIVVNGHTVSFSGIEEPVAVRRFQEFTLAVDNRFDDPWIRDAGSGLTSVSHQSDPGAPGLLRFSEVATFVHDGSAIDVTANWTIGPGALNAAGLAWFEMQTGSDLTLVADHTLEGPATAATLAVRNLAGGATQHLVYGTATRLEAASFDHFGLLNGAFVALAALAADDSVVYQLDGEGVDNLFFIGPQADVELTLAAADARLLDGGGQLIVAGTGLTTLWLPTDVDGRLRVRTIGSMTVDIRATVFPHFQFDPIFGLDLSPIGIFHMRPVTATDDDAGSLRRAIESANAAPAAGTAVVFFDLRDTDPGYVDIDGDAEPDVFVISPLAELPPLTRGNTVINGAAQQALTGDSNPSGPEIVLTGNLAGADANGLHLASSNNRVHGLNIRQFSGDGVLVTSDGNRLTASFIGTNALGLGGAANGGDGIRIVNANANRIGGTTDSARNVISGNTGNGVAISGGAKNAVLGNYIGTARDGDQLLGNGASGIFVNGSSNNVIGGILAGAGNVISGNVVDGIRFIDSLRDIVQGNRIGTDLTGTWDRGNGRAGLLIANGGEQLIGGAADEASNVISGNTHAGIELLSGPSNVQIVNNYIGTNQRGDQAVPNNGPGVAIAAYHTQVLNNLISGNVQGGGVIGTARDGNMLHGNIIGLNALGTAVIRNLNDGVSISVSSNNVIGGIGVEARNLISGNLGHGIRIENSTTNVIRGNYLGANPDTNPKLGNGGAGIYVENGSGNLIGGPLNGQGNIITANAGDGIAMNGASGGTLEGNFVGANPLGDPLGNGANGISLLATSGVQVLGNLIGANIASGVLLDGSTGNQIIANDIGSTGRTKPVLGNAVGLTMQASHANHVDGNVISGNTDAGIELSGASQNTISNNLVGVAFDGRSPLGNGVGVSLGGGSKNVFDNNTISGNLSSGVVLASGLTTDNRFFRNRIGMSADGSVAVGNGGFGVQIGKGAQGNFIGSDGDGSDDPHEGNTIAHNALAGVVVLGDASIGNTIRGNSIHSNGGLGIDLGGDSVTPIDEADHDIDSGPNNLQNFPSLRRVTTGAATQIIGTLKSAINTTFVIDFYASANQDPSLHGEGQRWLGSAIVTSDANGTAPIPNIRLESPTTAGEFITATATDPFGNTSEFSAAFDTTPNGGNGNGGGNGGGNKLTAEAFGEFQLGESLTDSALQPILAEAVHSWQILGFDSDRLAALDVRVADLPGKTLGLADGDTIWLDGNAAGWGWFIDPTPWDDSEFSTPGDQGEQGRIDLLTALAHELGHVLGFEHQEEGVMEEVLAAGARETPAGSWTAEESALLDLIFAGEHSPLRRRSWHVQ